jgi:hypothetical protein
LQYLNEDAANIVLIEDRSKTVFVAIGEYYSSDYTPDRFDCNSCRDGRLIQVVLKACTDRNVRLPYLVFDSEGKLICSTMGEAFDRKVPIW